MPHTCQLCHNTGLMAGCNVVRELQCFNTVQELTVLKQRFGLYILSDLEAQVHIASWLLLVSTLYSACAYLLLQLAACHAYSHSGHCATMVAVTVNPSTATGCSTNQLMSAECSCGLSVPCCCAVAAAIAELG